MRAVSMSSNRLDCLMFISGTFPIDTTKTRLQIQGQKIDQQFTKLRYSGMTDAFVKISKQEGVAALYSGYVSVIEFVGERELR